MPILEVVWNGAHEGQDRDLIDASLRVQTKTCPPHDPKWKPPPSVDPEAPKGLMSGGVPWDIDRFVETTLREQFTRLLYRGSETRFTSDTDPSPACGACQKPLTGSDIFKGRRHGSIRLCQNCVLRRWRARRRHYDPAIYAERKAAGLCGACGQPARPDRVTCAACAAQQAAAHAKQRQRDKPTP